MSLTFHWFLPTNGDSRDIVGGGHGVASGAAGAMRAPTAAYLGQIARSAEQLGFAGALTPTGAWCEDAWLTTAMSGYPHLEESYWFGEGVLPILERRGLWSHPAPSRDADQSRSPFVPAHATQATREKATAI